MQGGNEDGGGGAYFLAVNLLKRAWERVDKEKIGQQGVAVVFNDERQPIAYCANILETVDALRGPE